MKGEKYVDLIHQQFLSIYVGCLIHFDNIPTSFSSTKQVSYDCYAIVDAEYMQVRHINSF